MSYQPPKTIWEVHRQLSFNEPLKEEDPRFVPTEAGRGDFSLNRLVMRLGIDPANLQRKTLPPESQYIIFCGHRGSGKSTELRRLARQLHEQRLFFVVFLDTLECLDVANLQYADVLLAMAQRLIEKLRDADVKIDARLLRPLEYNNLWRRSHPVIRTLPAYRRLASKKHP